MLLVAFCRVVTIGQVCKFRICRPAGALNCRGWGFYKYFAPAALGGHPKPVADFAACSAVGAAYL